MSESNTKKMKFSCLEYISTLKTSGSIGSSSKPLINKCLKNLSFKGSKIILEFGMGDGCITEEVLKKTGKNTIMHSFEINPKFFSFCKNKFKDSGSIKLHNMSAIYFDKVLKENSIDKVDYIISSLPLSLFAKDDTDLLLKKIMSHLKTDGFFVQYQYSPNNRSLFKSMFKTVHEDFTLWNLPPAFIYSCRIDSSSAPELINELISTEKNN